MNTPIEDLARVTYASKNNLAPLMKACSAYNERRTLFLAQPKSNIEMGIWSERIEAPEMMRLAEDLFRYLLKDTGLHIIRSRETDLGLAPRSSLHNIMWGDISIAVVFYGGRLSSERIDEIITRVPNQDAVVLLVTIEPPDFASAAHLKSTRISGKTIIIATPADIDALASGGWSVIKMIYYKLFSALLLGDNDQQTIFDSITFSEFVSRLGYKYGADSLTLDAAIANQELPFKHWLVHPIVTELVSSISTRNFTFLLGGSASGKSMLALSVGRIRQEAGEIVYVIDAGAVSDDIVLSACNRILADVQSKSHVLLILDDMQSNPRIATNVLAWVCAMQSCGLSDRLRLLGVSWPEFLPTSPTLFATADIHIIAASQMTPAMADSSRKALSDSQIDFAITASGSDLFVLRLVLNALRVKQKDLNREMLASIYWEERTRNLRIPQETAKRAMLVACTIGQYECEVSNNFLQLQANVSDADVADMCRCKLLRRSGQRFHAGHRSLCNLLANWLTTEVSVRDWSTSEELDGSEQLVLNYIRSLRPREIWPILELIQGHSGFRAPHELRESGRIMTDAWQAIDCIVDRIGQQQKSDPTWGKVPSSAMFAIQALCAVGKHDFAQHSMDFIRSAYSISEDKLAISTEDLGTNNDFVQIRERMIEEDTVTDLYTSSNIFESGNEIDSQLFHETWFAGLTLCAEAFWSGGGGVIPHDLALKVEQRCAPQGFFYPARVPWCTARVLMGLALCGRTVINSPVVKRAANWLLTPRSEGGVYNDGLWDSGTGAWNTALETTAMCLISLLLVKVDPSDTKIKKGLSELIARKAEWARAGREIDGAMALLAFSMLRTDWRLVLPQLYHLATWARGEAIWQAATMTSKETFDQSCKVAEVGALLVDVLWRMLRADLPQLLHSFAISTEDTKPMGQYQPELYVAPITEKVAPLNADIASIIANVPDRLRLCEYTVVGRYARYSHVERHILKDLCSRIELACRAKTSARQNFVLWGRPGTGKTYLITELADSLKIDVSFHEINLAKCDKDSFEGAVKTAEDAANARIVFIDEVDAHNDAAWPFDILMPRLDMNTKSGNSIVWILAGSSSESIEAFILCQKSRTKGADVFDRVPATNIFCVPLPDHGDRLLVAVSQALSTAEEMGKAITAIERFALFYLLSLASLSTPRQVRESVVRACERVALGQKSIKYDHFFDAGDKNNKAFWAANQQMVELLGGQYVEIER